MSDTPRTDEAMGLGIEDGERPRVPIGFARALERENALLKANLTAARDLIFTLATAKVFAEHKDLMDALAKTKP